MAKNYSTYKNGLKVLKIDTLEKRREVLSLRFAENCLKNEKVKSMFPLNDKKHAMKIRKPRKYKTYKQNTKRLKKSALPYMRKLLNDKNKRKKNFFQKYSNNESLSKFVSISFILPCICSSEL